VEKTGQGTQPIIIYTTNTRKALTRQLVSWQICALGFSDSEIILSGGICQRIWEIEKVRKKDSFIFLRQLQ
jgi:hypothetical protein